MEVLITRVFPLFFLLCLSSAAYAAPSYGPDMPKQKQVFGGVQSYVVFNRTLESGYGSMHSAQEFLLLSYGVTDWLSIDLKGGLGNVHQRSNNGPDFNYAIFLAGGYGFRLKLYDVNNTKATIGFEHISVHPYTQSLDGSKHKVVLDDWQFPILIGHDFGVIRPYAGVRWSWMNQIHWVNTDRKLEKSDLGRSVGLIVGTDIPFNSRVWLNVEGQFFDAKALAASINFSF